MLSSTSCIALLALLAVKSFASPVQAPRAPVSELVVTSLPISSSTPASVEKRDFTITFEPAFPTTSTAWSQPKKTSTSPKPTSQPVNNPPQAAPKPSTASVPSRPPTATSATACSEAPTFSPAVPQPVAGSCSGYPAVDDADGIEYIGVKDVANCADACWDESKCESFAVSLDGQSCLIYQRPLSKMTRKTGANYLFYDKYCLFDTDKDTFF